MSAIKSKHPWSYKFWQGQKLLFGGITHKYPIGKEVMNEAERAGADSVSYTCYVTGVRLEWTRSKNEWQLTEERRKKETAAGKAVAALIVALATSVLSCSAYSGTVTGVTDGDTIRVTTETGKKEKIVRLAEIDAPEKDQPWGDSATDHLTGLLLEKKVEIKERGKDRYGRIIGTVTLEDGRVLNDWLVMEGWAWWYQAYSKSNKVLEELQRHAQTFRHGLWSQSDAIAPWDWRKGVRPEPTAKVQYVLIKIGDSFAVGQKQEWR